MNLANNSTAYRQTEPGNLKGRDFVVADLHGSYTPLMRALEAVKFDTTVDRLFSVGDLADRGEESLECVLLLGQPWFRAVRGNHEAMLLQYLGIKDSEYFSSSDFRRNGGSWVDRLSARDLETLTDVCRRHVVNLPLVRTISHAAGDFDIAHAELYVDAKVLSDKERITARAEGAALWGRDLIYSACNTLSDETIRDWNADQARSWKVIEPAMEPTKRLTYVGHTILNMPILTRSHFFIDGGLYRNVRNIPEVSAELFEHTRVMEWVRSLG